MSLSSWEQTKNITQVHVLLGFYYFKCSVLFVRVRVFIHFTEMV